MTQLLSKNRIFFEEAEVLKIRELAKDLSSLVEEYEIKENVLPIFRMELSSSGYNMHLNSKVNGFVHFYINDGLLYFYIRLRDSKLFTLIANFIDDRFKFDFTNSDKLTKRFEESFNKINNFVEPLTFKGIKAKKMLDCIATGRKRFSCSDLSSKQVFEIQNLKGQKFKAIYSQVMCLMNYEGELVPTIVITIPEGIYYSKNLKLYVFADGSDRVLIRNGSFLELETLSDETISGIISKYEHSFLVKQYNAMKKVLKDDFTMKRSEFLSMPNEERESLYLVSQMYSYN